MNFFLTCAVVPVAFAALLAAGILIQRPFVDGPGRPIVVVDRRTYRLAQKRVVEAIESGNLTRAQAGTIAIRKWLKSEVRTGRQHRRAGYAAELERWEAQSEQLNVQVFGHPTGRETI